MTSPDDTELENRLTGAIDGVLHLLDRQLIDCDGRFLGKVDDVELTPDQTTGRLVITALLTGPAALLDRFGGRLGRVLPEVEAVPRGVHEAELGELWEEMTSVRRSAPPGSQW